MKRGLFILPAILSLALMSGGAAMAQSGERGNSGKGHKDREQVEQSRGDGHAGKGDKDKGHKGKDRDDNARSDDRRDDRYRDEQRDRGASEGTALERQGDLVVHASSQAGRQAEGRGRRDPCHAHMTFQSMVCI